MAPEDYFVFRDQSRTFQDIGIYVETDTDRDVNVTGFAEPERVHALDVTAWRSFRSRHTANVRPNLLSF